MLRQSVNHAKPEIPAPIPESADNKPLISLGAALEKKYTGAQLPDVSPLSSIAQLYLGIKVGRPYCL